MKMVTFIGLRKWLKRNKIFFEVVVTIALTIMAIYVSNTANQIASYQNELIKNENQPIFVFNMSVDEHKKLNYSENNISESIEIENIGKPAYNFSAKSYIFFDIKLKDRNSGEMKNVIIPITSFYNGGEYRGSPTGYMRTFYHYSLKNGIDNYSKRDEVVEKINYDLYSYSKGEVFADVDLKRYVLINYYDVYGENHDDLYSVGVLNYVKLSENDKIFFENKYNKQLKRFSVPNIQYIQPKEIYEFSQNLSSEYHALPSAYNPLPGID